MSRFRAVRSCRLDGRLVVSTAWADDEALRASREKVPPPGSRADEPAGSATPVVDEWEIALMHQAHLEKLEGFASASLLLNRSTGASMLSVAFDTPAALEATRGDADYLRAKSSQEVDVEFLDFAELELVLSYFAAPERVEPA